MQFRFTLMQLGMSKVPKTSISLLWSQHFFWQLNYWFLELIWKTQQDGDLSDIRFLSLTWSEHSALPAQWLLRAAPQPLLIHSRSLSVVFRAENGFFKCRHRELFMSYFFSFEKHFLVNNVCSSHKGHYWQGVRRSSGLYVYIQCTDHCM